MAYVYILRCADQSLYVGSTRDLDLRLEQHSAGSTGTYTDRRRPVKLLWFQELERIDDAWALERQLHGWSREKKLALIRGDWSALRGYSARRRR